MKRPPIKISLIMYSLNKKGRKRKDFDITVDVKCVMKSIHIWMMLKMEHGATHATRLISEKTLTNERQAIKRLIILFKILKFMHGKMILHWNGIRGKTFQRLKKSEKVVMEPFFALKPK